MICGKEQPIPMETPPVTPFREKLRASNIDPLRSGQVETLQINVGRRCNLSCGHCHVAAGPQERESMSRELLASCLAIAGTESITTIDITGGAPEMNDHLPWFLDRASLLGKRVMVRSNLVILLEKEYGHLIEVFSRNRVELVVSLPHWKKEKCDRQRGEGSFDTIIAALRLVNGRGWAQPDSGLVIDIAHNPVGAYLPGSQKALEREYRERLLADYGVRFNRLFCLTNCPTGRFRDYLMATDNYDEYMKNLELAFNPAAALGAMCRTTLSVGWDGTLYDCDFNQWLRLPVNHGATDRVDRFDAMKLQGREIMTGDHCYACTAGQGSSCTGAAV